MIEDKFAEESSYDDSADSPHDNYYGAFYSERYEADDFDHCGVIASPTFVRPMNMSSETMKSCFFEEWELGYSATKEACMATCLNRKKFLILKYFFLKML